MTPPIHELPDNARGQSSRQEADDAPAEAAARELHREVIAKLLAAPDVRVTRDLLPGIWARIEADESCRMVAPVVRPWYFRAATWAAAALVMLAAVMLANLGPSGSTAPLALARHTAAVPGESAQPAVERALDWFCREQEANGAWDAAKWGGDPRFEASMTALPLLALLRAEPVSPERARVVTRATGHLRALAERDGYFGVVFPGTPYNQGIGTLALLQAYARNPEPALKGTIDSALQKLSGQQLPGGGWGYLPSRQANLSITLWHAEAIELAVRLGWQELQPRLQRAHAWIATQPSTTRNPDLVLGAAAGLDFYHAYCLANALKRKGDDSSRQRLADIRNSVRSLQIQAGSDSGTWAADQWDRFGGRLFATAMASLALN